MNKRKEKGMNEKGWICLHRKILNWEWYEDTNTFRVFIHCLLKANIEDGKFEGKIIPRGSFVTSLLKLSQQTKMTIQQIRTSLNHLKSTQEITITTTNKFTLITINNYNQYQNYNIEDNKQLTNDQQTTNKQLTTIKQYNNKQLTINNNKKESIKKKSFEKPTIEEIKEYCEERNNDINVEAFYDFYESKDWYVGKNKMKDWKACIRTWEQRKIKSQCEDRFERLKRIQQEVIDEHNRSK